MLLQGELQLTQLQSLSASATRLVAKIALIKGHNYRGGGLAEEGLCGVCGVGHPFGILPFIGSDVRVHYVFFLLGLLRLSNFVNISTVIKGKVKVGEGEARGWGG